MLRHKSKRWVFIFFVCVIVMPTFFLVGFYSYDPLMLFHKPTNRPITLSRNMRAQIPGIISQLEYDSYIVGTSMLGNTSANNASKILGGHFANISMNGADFYERSYVLDYALRNKAKTIIYSLDSYYLTQRRGKERYPTSSFSYLYSDQFNKIKFYFQGKYILCLLMWSSSSKCIGYPVSLDRPKSWMNDKRYVRRFGGIQNWFSAENSSQIKEVFEEVVRNSKKGGDAYLGKEKLNFEIKKAISYIDDNLLFYVKAYPKSTFHFIFPPYSRIRYATWHQRERTKAKVHEAVVRHLVERSVEFDNLDLYGYEDQGFLDNISNYKDLGHYHWWVNEKMLKDIAEKNHVLTKQNVDSYLYKARVKSLKFDLVGLGRRIDMYLNKKREKSREHRTM